jgi:gliding motility-associated-like protein
MYGVEFSSNSKLLYVANSGYNIGPGMFRADISQYNYLDSSVSTIITSRTELDADTGASPINPFYSALQLGPDGKMYMIAYPGNRLSVINQPDVPGIGCNYSRKSLVLAPGTSNGLGLPDFNQSYFKGTFTYNVSCKTTGTAFYSTKPNNASSIKWDFGDPASGTNNASLVDSPYHVFSSPGTYTVKLIDYLVCRNDTMKKIVKIEPAIADLGPDKTICSNMPYQLDPHSPGNSTYLWQDNSTNSTYMASQSGLYWVEVKNTTSGCINRDSIQLSFKPNPNTSLGNDTILCETNTLLLDAGNPGALYTWQDNSHNQTLLASSAGTYFVKVNLNGCESSDTIIIQTKYIPRVFLGNDTTICNGMTMMLTPVLDHAENADFLWNTGQTIANISVTQPGSYSLAVKNLCGTGTDEIIIKQGVCKLYIPTAFTPNNDGKNDILKPGYGENVTSYSMEIYNRSGEKVFTSNNIYKGWDGKLKGVLQPVSLFVWFIRYKILNDPKEYFQKGTIALIY